MILANTEIPHDWRYLFITSRINGQCVCMKFTGLYLPMDEDRRYFHACLYPMKFKKI